MARTMGLTMSQWDALDEYDRAWALAADVAESEDNAEKCSQCGALKSVCQNTDNQHAFVVTFRRCYVTAAISAATASRNGDLAGVVPVVNLDPSRKKSATQKGASARG